MPRGAENNGRVAPLKSTLCSCTRRTVAWMTAARLSSERSLVKEAYATECHFFGAGIGTAAGVDDDLHVIALRGVRERRCLDGDLRINA